MEIVYKNEDHNIEIRLVYIVGQRFKRYWKNKYYPKVTQCLMFYNGLLYDYSEIIKHEKDKDNQITAYKIVTKKTILKFEYKFILKELYIKFLTELNTKYDTN